jgi:hypothetical protein
MQEGDGGGVGRGEGGDARRQSDVAGPRQRRRVAVLGDRQVVADIPVRPHRHQHARVGGDDVGEGDTVGGHQSHQIGEDPQRGRQAQGDQ